MRIPRTADFGAQARHQRAEIGKAGRDHRAVVDAHRLVPTQGPSPGNSSRCGGRDGLRPRRRRRAAPPSTIRSSPTISCATPAAARPAATAASRSLSLTRSSCRPRIRVVPRANAAATARIGIFVDHRGRARRRHVDAASVRSRARANRRPPRRPRRARRAFRFGRPFRAASSASPDRNGLVITPSTTMSEPGMISAATIGNAADEGSAGTLTGLGRSSGRPTQGDPPPFALDLDAARRRRNGRASFRCGRARPRSR